MTYTGHDNVFIAAPDRGPFDGATDVSGVESLPAGALPADIVPVQ
jgi:hypothetical protein